MNIVRTLFVLVFIGVSAMAAGLVADEHEGRKSERKQRQEIARRALDPVSNAAWKEECASCHTLFHPGLLPARSWTAIMAGLGKHFGDDASLDVQVNAEITRFLIANSAERAESQRSRRIADSIPLSASPLRFTETRYFLREHDDLKSSVYSRPSIGTPANCSACHRGADAGEFDEHNVKVPKQ
jgi:hypothetical protein